MRLAWARAALHDLPLIREYIAADRPEAAGQQVGRILAAVSGLLRFPEMGRVGRVPGTRELVVSRTPHIVPYRLRGEIIQILRVLHGRRRWPVPL